ncbi:MAG: tetratricopeptide repeat protein [Planctomycetota bacterium]
MFSPNRTAALLAVVALGSAACRTTDGAFEATGGVSDTPVEATAESPAALADAEESVVAETTPAEPEIDSAILAVVDEAESGVAVKAIPAAYGLQQDDGDEVASAASLGGPDFSAVEIAYFNTAEFRREFARSWLSRNDIEPDVTPDEVEDLREVVDLVRSGDDAKIQRAWKKLRRAVERNEESPQFRYLLGLMHFNAEEYAESIVHFDVAIGSYGNFLRAHQNKALAHFAIATRPIPEGDDRSEEEIASAQAYHFDQAGDSFRKQLTLGGINGQTYGYLGIVLAGQEHHLEAETAFRNALLYDPTKELWRTGLVTTLLAQRDFGAAASLLDTLIEESPDNKDYWKLQGSAYAGLEDLDSAARNLVVAQGLGDTDATSAFLLADIYMLQRHLELSAEAYVRAVGLASSTGLASALQGTNQLVQRGAPEAAREVLTAIEETHGVELDDETLADVRKLQSQVAVRLGDAEGEIEILEAILEDNPMDGEAMTLLAMALGKRGSDNDLARAVQYFETAASIEGAGAKATLEHGRFLVRQRRYTDAVPLLKTSLSLEDVEYVRAYLGEVEKAAKQSGR